MGLTPPTDHQGSPNSFERAADGREARRRGEPADSDCRSPQAPWAGLRDWPTSKLNFDQCRCDWSVNGYTRLNPGRCETVRAQLGMAHRPSRNVLRSGIPQPRLPLAQIARGNPHRARLRVAAGGSSARRETGQVVDRRHSPSADVESGIRRQEAPDRGSCGSPGRARRGCRRTARVPMTGSRSEPGGRGWIVGSRETPPEGGRAARGALARGGRSAPVDALQGRWVGPLAALGARSPAYETDESPPTATSLGFVGRRADAGLRRQRLRPDEIPNKSPEP
jgi:hypothetical protein